MISAPTITVRRATMADIPAIVRMGCLFLASSAYRDVLRENPAQMAAFAEVLIGREDGYLAVMDEDTKAVGMIGFLAVPHFFSGDVIATEVIWWLDPDARGAGRLLLDAAEGWAHEIGAVAIQMIAPDPRVGRLYERRGYRFVESAWQKTW